MDKRKKLEQSKKIKRKNNLNRKEIYRINAKKSEKFSQKMNQNFIFTRIEDIRVSPFYFYQKEIYFE